MSTNPFNPVHSAQPGSTRGTYVLSALAWIALAATVYMTFHKTHSL